MDPIPVYFQLVNRSALVVKPKKPFYDWLASIDPGDKPEEMLKEGDVYLAPEHEGKKLENWLKKNFHKIFEDQLNHWYIDEAVWPKPRTFKMFTEWFDYSLYTMVWDTQEKFIEKT